MLKKLVSTFVLIIFALAVHCQDLGPCGTLDHKSDWLKNFQRNINQYDRTMDTLKYIPMTIHVLGTDQGVGYFSPHSIYAALCKLNMDYEDTNIQFYIAGDLNYIDSSAWYSHETVLVGAEMMFANNVENTINTYFVSDPAGNCGYNLPYAGIAMSKSCSSPTDYTWAHEIGHNLSIQHTFLGWEGDLYDYDVPTPTTVTYDYTYFKDTLIIDTLIIDTTFVELVDGSNCLVAADGFCDTAPDYISYRWNCDGNNQSPFVLKDPNNEDFYVDGSFIMSYSNDLCQSRFSEDQICAMHANIMEEKPELLQGQTPQPYDDSASILYAPANESIVPQDLITLSWSAKENVNGYFVRVSRTPTMSVLRYTGIVQDTFVVVPDLQITKKHYWEVVPLNNFHGCYETPTTWNFTVDSPTSTQNIFTAIELNLQNNLLSNNESLVINSDLDYSTQLKVQIFDISGKLVLEKDLDIIEGQTQSIVENKFGKGQYFIKMFDKKKSYSSRFINF